MLSRSEDAALFWATCVATLFLPSGFNKMLTFSVYAASLAVKGLAYPTVIASILMAAEFLCPLALIIGLWPRWTALVLIGFTAGTLWITYGQSVMGLVFRPLQNVDFFQSLAIIGGLLFYFGSRPGGESRTSLR